VLRTRESIEVVQGFCGVTPPCALQFVPCQKLVLVGFRGAATNDRGLINYLQY
jgi:hypothetical protein